MSADDLTRWAIWIAALVGVAIPVWIVIQLIATPIRLLIAERKNGAWDGRQFLYFEPPLISMSRFAPEDNGKCFIITFDDAEPNSLVRWRIDVDNPIVGAGITPYQAPAIFHSLGLKPPRGSAQGAIRIDEKKRAVVVADGPPDAEIATIRVRMTSFEV